MSNTDRQSARQRGVLVAVALACAAALALPGAASAATNNIFTVAGDGTAAFGGDGGLATGAQIQHPNDVASTADGGYLIADTVNNRIRMVDPDGTITTVAGDGTNGFGGDGGPATSAQLSSPTGVSATEDGGFLICDFGSSHIRQVDPSGQITTVAGTGTPGFSGDGGPASAAQLNFPQAVAPLPDGGYLIADSFNDRIRMVDPSGTITTVAGDGTNGFGGDGGPATAAQLGGPVDVSPTADGGYLIADLSNDRVREVDSSGQITTVAGTGAGGFSGDGGPATAAEVDDPVAVTETPDGGFLLTTPSSARVRRVSPSGRITTVAGDGTNGFGGDGGPATSAQLTFPAGLAVTADGGFLLADTYSNRIRYVDADLGSPKGDTGAQGPTGPQGPQGPSGEDGADAPLLAVAIAADVTKTKSTKAKVRIVTTLPGTATLEASPSGKSKRKARGAKKAKPRSVTKALSESGRSTLKLTKLARGQTYGLSLNVESADGQTANDTAKLKVKMK